MKRSRRMILSIVWIVLGVSLLGANLTGLLGDYWGGLGGGLLGVDGKGIQIIPAEFGIKMLTLPVGGFLVLACLIAAMQWALSKSKK